VFLRLAADALEWCGASRADPLPLEGLRERFLPEATFRGRRNAKLQYAVLAAAAVHGGTEPDLLDEVAWWQADNFWQYALYAAAAYRAAASRAGVPVRQACQDLDGRAQPPSAIATMRPAVTGSRCAPAASAASPITVTVGTACSSVTRPWLGVPPITGAGYNVKLLMMPALMF
jgi:hypothetical protein